MYYGQAAWVAFETPGNSLIKGVVLKSTDGELDVDLPRTIADVQVQGDAIMTVESHLEFGIFAAIGRALLTGPAASALSGLIPVVAAAARDLDRPGDELLDKAIAVPNGLGNPGFPAGLNLGRIGLAVEVSSSRLAGHGFDTHTHPHFFFTVHGHIQDGNKTTDEGTDGHEADHKQATDVAVYFNTATGDVTSPRSSPSTSTSGGPDPPRSSSPTSLHQPLRSHFDVAMSTMGVGRSLRPAAGARLRPRA